MDRSVTKSVAVECQGLRTGTVLIIIPGGLEHGGGIGRQMGYFLGAYQTSGQRLHYRVVDSRGPWYLGSSPLHVAGAVIYLSGAILKLFQARRSSPCLLHVNITGRGSTIRKLLLLIVARALGLRYVLHVHDYDYAKYYNSCSTFLKSRIATMFRRAETVVMLGRRDLEVVSQLLQLPKDRMIVLHNAVPDPLPNLDRKRNPGQPCHLLFLGYLSARKGVADLLQALASPRLRHLNWRATLAGDGPIDEFRNLAEGLGISKRVRFPGWVDQVSVSKLCSDADALVLPSYAEGLAMSVLEGLAHGLAVITTPVGAHSEVIEPGVSGILVRPGDVTGLADALGRVIEDENVRQGLARAGRERFLEGFDVRRYASRLEHIHASLLTPQCDQARLIERGGIS